MLYDADSLQAAADLIAGWTPADRQQLLRDVPRLGLSAEIAGRPVLDIARELLAVAEAGLRRRAIPGPEGESDETAALEPLARWLEAGQSPADQLIAAFEGPWQATSATSTEPPPWSEAPGSGCGSAQALVFHHCA